MCVCVCVCVYSPGVVLEVKVIGDVPVAISTPFEDGGPLQGGRKGPHIPIQC